MLIKASVFCDSYVELLYSLQVAGEVVAAAIGALTWMSP